LPAAGSLLTTAALLRPSLLLARATGSLLPLLLLLMTTLLVGFLQAAQTYLPYHIHKFGFHNLGLISRYIHRFQFLGNYTLLVESFYFQYPLNS
jgi:hypothetical protein